MEALRSRAMNLEHDLKEEIDKVVPEHRASARNLVHYLAVRQEDIRSLQSDLAEIGLLAPNRRRGLLA